MKLVSFDRAGGAGYGALINGGVIDLSKRPGMPKSINELLGNDRYLAEAAGLVAGGKADYALSEVTLAPVVPHPAKVICVGLNYAAHAAEAGRKVGEYPVIFHRYAETLTAHGAPLIRPKVSSDFDFEGELAVVIGCGGSHISREDAMSHVAGYTIFNDASVRDWQFHTHQYGMGKNFRSSGPLGPVLVTADEIPDYRKLTLTTRLNGEQMQYGELHELAFDVPLLISYVSQALPWQPGDILATGTPSGIGFKRTPPIWLKPGDVVDITISEIGTLSNPVIAEE